MNKWHYFNENDKNCWMYASRNTKTRYLYTACGMPVGDILRHTEDKSQVDCLICLRRLNKKMKEMAPPGYLMP